jgi:hypothetical protein
MRVFFPGITLILGIVIGTAIPSSPAPGWNLLSSDTTTSTVAYDTSQFSPMVTEIDTSKYLRVVIVGWMQTTPVVGDKWSKGFVPTDLISLVPETNQLLIVSSLCGESTMNFCGRITLRPAPPKKQLGDSIVNRLFNVTSF